MRKFLILNLSFRIGQCVKLKQLKKIREKIIFFSSYAFNFCASFKRGTNKK